MAAPHAPLVGFRNAVDPTPAELRTWAYAPDAVPLSSLPADWDLLLAGEALIGTLFALAKDPACPARRFALHCLHIYAADAIRTGFRSHSKRRLRKMLDHAEHGDDAIRLWSANCRALLAQPDLFSYEDWCAGGLVRTPRHIV